MKNFALKYFERDYFSCKFQMPETCYRNVPLALQSTAQPLRNGILICFITVLFNLINGFIYKRPKIEAWYMSSTTTTTKKNSRIVEGKIMSQKVQQQKQSKNENINASVFQILPKLIDCTVDVVG